MRGTGVAVWRPVTATEWERERVGNVLIAPITALEFQDAARPSGRAGGIQLAFPRPYAASLRGCVVEALGRFWAVAGDPAPCDACPTAWWMAAAAYDPDMGEDVAVERASRTMSPAGDARASWEAACAVRARVSASPLDEAAQAGTERPRRSIEAVAYATPELLAVGSAAHRIVWRGEAYDVVAAAREGHLGSLVRMKGALSRV